MPHHHHQIPMSYSTLDDSTWEDVDRAWKHLVRSSGSDESTTIKTYTDALKAVEQQARSIYIDDRPLAPIPQTDEFIRIMTQNGCFILQVALASLGACKTLNYPADDPVFGELRDKQRIKCWVTSIFDIKNQIPLVVFKELIKQKFFQDVIESVKWRRHYKDLQKITLYEFLVAPMLGNRRGKLGEFARLILHYGHYQLEVQEPPTLIHALWLRLTGPDYSSRSNCDNKDEEDEDEEGLNARVWPVMRAAMNLQQVGIRFKNNAGMGTRGVRFKKRLFDAVLELPFLRIECETERLFKNLIEYENEIYTDRNKRLVCTYLQLMRELVCTSDDANVLALCEVILADPKQEEELPEMLRRLPLQEVGNSHNLVRRQVRAYIKPSKWVKLKNLVSLAIVLTLIQTVYTVLTFHFGK